MLLTLSKRSSLIAQSEIRAMTLACARIGGINLAQGVCDTDEVMLFEPYYGYHVNTILAVGAVPVYVSMHPPDWSFSPEDLERVVTRRTRGIMINTPANPSGKVFR